MIGDVRLHHSIKGGSWISHNRDKSHGEVTIWSGKSGQCARTALTALSSTDTTKFIVNGEGRDEHVGTRDKIWRLRSRRKLDHAARSALPPGRASGKCIPRLYMMEDTRQGFLNCDGTVHSLSSSRAINAAGFPIPSGMFMAIALRSCAGKSLHAAREARKLRYWIYRRA